MGFFKRKTSKLSFDGVSTTSSTTNSVNYSLKSPATAKTPNTSASFTSPSLPDFMLPRPPDADVDPIAYLRSTYAVRDRASIVMDKAAKKELNHFDVDFEKFEATAKYTVSIIKAGLAGWCDADCMADLRDREIMLPTTSRYPYTDVGSTLRLVEDPGSISYSPHGPWWSITKNGRAVSSTCSWFPSSWMPALARDGRTNRKKAGRSIVEAKA